MLLAGWEGRRMGWSPASTAGHQGNRSPLIQPVSFCFLCVRNTKLMPCSPNQDNSQGRDRAHHFPAIPTAKRSWGSSILAHLYNYTPPPSQGMFAQTCWLVTAAGQEQWWGDRGGYPSSFTSCKAFHSVHIKRMELEEKKKKGNVTTQSTKRVVVTSDTV